MHAKVVQLRFGIDARIQGWIDSSSDFAERQTMQQRFAPSVSPERSAAILEEALRRIEASIPDPELNLGVLRQVLETELAKGPLSLVKLMKVGRRRAIDRIARMSRKEAARAGRP